MVRTTFQCPRLSRRNGNVRERLKSAGYSIQNEGEDRIQAPIYLRVLVSMVDPEIVAEANSVLESIVKLEQFIDDEAFVPATAQHRGQVLLALFSKCLTVSRATCALVQAGFGEEAFGITRTLIEIYFIVRYISNNDTEDRAERFAMFFTKDQEGWRSIVPKYYPHLVPPNTPETAEILAKAKNYKSPHQWSGEPQGTKSLAMEPDTYEFEPDIMQPGTDKGTMAEFDYEVLYKWTSHYVHSTVCGLEHHITERGDTFKIRHRWSPNRKAKFALFNVLTMISKTFVCGFRGLRREQPEAVLNEIFRKTKNMKLK
jgi:hypothetical protein